MKPKERFEGPAISPYATWTSNADPKISKPNLE
jgi:hypothetical protein